MKTSVYINGEYSDGILCFKLLLNIINAGKLLMEFYA